MKAIDRSRRRLYPGGRPSRLSRVLNRASGWVHALGVWPRRLVTLEVAGRRTGSAHLVPLVMVDLDGDRYLVAMLGRETNWVRNIRAAGGRAVLRHGVREDVHLEEVEPAARPPILRRYLACAPGARPHIPVDRRASLDAIANVAPQIPVFRVTSASPLPH
jgi:deazaflavin-dependent oxidoreductase (nitroreductase family)